MSELKPTNELEVEDAKELLAKEGYEVLRLEKIWRNITGHVRKDDKGLFFKLAVSPEAAAELHNEYAWNEMFTGKPLEAPIKIPTNFESGEFKNSFWFTCEYIDGVALVEPDYTYIDGVAQRGPQYRIENPGQTELLMPKIAQTLRALLDYKSDGPLPGDIAREGKDRVLGFWNNIDRWVNDSGRELSGLVEFIHGKFGDFTPGLSHGDFTPWHLMLTKNGVLYLIDAEHAQTTGVKFYDLAYCYHRLYAVAQSPILADLLISEFKKIYSLSPQDRNCFYGILGQRLVGGYAELVHNKKYISEQLQDQLMERVLAEDIL